MKKTNKEINQRKVDKEIYNKSLSRVFENNYKKDNSVNWIIFILFSVSIFLIILGGVKRNIYEIISGGIILLFLYKSLK